MAKDKTQAVVVFQKYQPLLSLLYSPNVNAAEDEYRTENEIIRSFFPNALPDSRFGNRHMSLESFQNAISDSFAVINTNERIVVSTTPRQQKHYTLVLVTEPLNDHQRDGNFDESIPFGRILLGLKQRGFGKGFYNSFGGKVEIGEDIIQSAVRELQEETSIEVTVSDMSNSQVGKLHFTFDDLDVEMIVHLFRLRCTTREDNNNNNDGLIYINPCCIRGCDEIKAEWFQDWYTDLPLHQMFVDDSVWLTRILSTSPKSFNGWFHLAGGGTDVNTMLHYYLDATYDKGNAVLVLKNFTSADNCTNIPTKNTVSNSYPTSTSVLCLPTSEPLSTATQEKQFTLEQRLFHALHDNKVHSPSIKEFNECYAFCNTVRTFYFGLSTRNKKKTNLTQQPTSSTLQCQDDVYQQHQSSSMTSMVPTIRVVIDVAGGHGALGALFLIMEPLSVQRAVVIDPAILVGGQNGIQHGWGHLFDSSKLEYRHECLRTGLHSELIRALVHDKLSPTNVLVVACHACQHLSDETIMICTQYKVHVAVLPCCQKDITNTWKDVCRNLHNKLTIATAMDILLAGKAMATYPDVRIKVLNEKYTPQNRLILCRSPLLEHRRRSGTVSNIVTDDDTKTEVERKIDRQHRMLQIAYKKAHVVKNTNNTTTTTAVGHQNIQNKMSLIWSSVQIVVVCFVFLVVVVFNTFSLPSLSWVYTTKSLLQQRLLPQAQSQQHNEKTFVDGITIGLIVGTMIGACTSILVRPSKTRN